MSPEDLDVDLGALEQEIIDGDLETRFPAVGFLTTHADLETCTATLVAPDVLLTAGHCMGTPDLVAYFGEYADLADPHEIKRTLVYRGWRAIEEPIEFLHDVSALVLVEPPTGIAPMDIGPPAIGAEGLGIGYGLSALGGAPGSDPSDRKSVTMEVDGLAAGGSEIATHGINGTVCKGDSGGPLIQQGKVVGVASHMTEAALEDGLCVSGQPFRYANVAEPSNHRFIRCAQQRGGEDVPAWQEKYLCQDAEPFVVGLGFIGDQWAPYSPVSTKVDDLAVMAAKAFDLGGPTATEDALRSAALSVGLVRADRSMTREEAYVRLVRYLELELVETPELTFRDAADVSEVGARSIATAAMYGLIVNLADPDRFWPGDLITAEEWAAALYQALVLRGERPMIGSRFIFDTDAKYDGAGEGEGDGDATGEVVAGCAAAGGQGPLGAPIALLLLSLAIVAARLPRARALTDGIATPKRRAIHRALGLGLLLAMGTSTAACSSDGGGAEAADSGALPAADATPDATPDESSDSGPKTDGSDLAMYQFTDLGTLGGSGAVATAINSAGVVVGFSFPSDDLDCEGNTGPTRCQLPFRWEDGDMASLGRLDPLGDEGRAHAINDDGVIVGSEGDYTTESPYGTFKPFRYIDGTMEALDLPDGEAVGEAMGINNAGAIVGYSDDGGEAPNRLVLWTDEEPTIIASSEMFARRGYGINESGAMTGEEYMPSSFIPANAIVVPSTSSINLGTDNVRSMGLAINDDGVIAGGDAQKAHSPLQATLWRPDGENYTAEPVGLLGDDTSAVFNGINNSGVAVGTSGSSENGGRAVVYIDATLYDLNTITAGVPGTLRSANGINDAGQIVGSYDDSENVTRAFLLTPTE